MAYLINAYVSVVSPSSLDFPHKLNSHRDLNDTDLSEHLNGFTGYVYNCHKEMTRNCYHVMNHIQRVKNHYSMVIEDDNMNEFVSWAWENSAIVFLEDGSVRDPSGHALVYPDGAEPDEDAQLPYQKDAIDRLYESVDKINAIGGIPTTETLPPIIGVRECSPRDVKEISRRTMALLSTAVRAEALSQKEEFDLEEFKSSRPMSFECLTPAESSFLNNSSPEEQDVIDFVWRYEAIYALLWALSYIDELKHPDEICDVPLVARTVFSRDESDFIANAKLRSNEELLDALDLHFRLHWAAVDCRVYQNKRLENLHEGIVRERHYVLNWILEFQNNGVEWDDISTAT